MISQEQIDEYKRDGVIVIENVLSDDEVEKARNGLHSQLLEHGIDHDKVLSGEQILEEGPRLKGIASRIFYNKWKIDVCLHENVYGNMKKLMDATYLTDKIAGFENPFGHSDDILSYIDRVCWRLPDCVRSESGLGLHLDRNPYDPYLFGCGGLKKWRPIQAFVTLTDHYGSESGGLRVVKGFHNEIDSYFTGKEKSNGGEFYRLDSLNHMVLSKRLEPINAPKGSLVCWDNRLPHATCNKLGGYDTREVVYVGWLPNVEINRIYCKQQLNNIRENIPPPAYCDRGDNIKDRNWDEKDLTGLQRRMLGI